MKKLQKTIGIMLIMIGLLTACDDFMSPTVEVFFEPKIKVNHNTDQTQEQKIKQEEKNLEARL